MEIFWADGADKFLNVVNIIIEPKFTLPNWDGTRIQPIGNVDFVILQEGTDGVA